VATTPSARRASHTLTERGASTRRGLVFAGCAFLAHLLALCVLLIVAPSVSFRGESVHDHVLVLARLVSLLVVVVLAVATYLWMQWQAAAQPLRGGEAPVRTERWWWFVPVANLWMPFRTIRDLYVHGAERNREGANLTVLTVWFVAWALGIYAWTAGVLVDLLGGVDPASVALVLLAWGDLAMIVAAYFGYLVVDRITTWLSFDALHHPESSAAGA
jgi:Domain of unknown function (DUF4328)